MWIKKLNYKGDNLDYLFAFGMIILGLIALVATIFKYSKDEHKKDNFSNGSYDLFGLFLVWSWPFFRGGLLKLF